MKTFWLIGFSFLFSVFIQTGQTLYAIPQNQDAEQGNSVQRELKAFDSSCDISSVEIEEEKNLEIDGQHFIARKKTSHPWNGHPFYCRTILVSPYSIWLSEIGDLSPPTIK